MSTLIIGVAFLLLCLTYLALTRIIGRPISSENAPLAVWMLDLLVWPTGIVAFFVVVSELLLTAGLVEQLEKADLLQSFALHMALFWLIGRGVDLAFLRWFAFHRTGFTTPALLRGLSYALFLFAGFSLFLLRTGYPVTGFLVSTGLAAGILGFALQSTLNDLFSGIALSIEKPFHIGEWVELELSLIHI